MHTTRLYNTLIQHVQHAIIQHKVHTTHLYNTLVQQANQKLSNFKKAVKKKLKKDNAIQHIIKHAYNMKNTTRGRNTP